LRRLQGPRARVAADATPPMSFSKAGALGILTGLFRVVINVDDY